KERHGYGVERFRIESEFAVKVDPALGILGVLLEPASILAKAWDHTERIGGRARGWGPRTPPLPRARPPPLPPPLLWGPAQPQRPRLRSQHRRPETGAGARARRHLSLRPRHAPPAGAGHRNRVYRRAGGDPRLPRGDRRLRHRLPDRGHRARQGVRARYRP